MEVEDKTNLVQEINKMVQKNLYTKNTKTRLGEIKESILNFNTYFDKRMRARFPSCWARQGNILPWEMYVTLLVEAKRNIDSSHEKTEILKDSTIVNYL